MRVITTFDDSNEFDSEVVLTKKSGFRELGEIVNKYKVRAVCISDDYITCCAITRKEKWSDMMQA